MKKFTLRHIMGTFISAAVIVLVANVLNYFFDWTVAAFAIGAVVGLEVGFFVINAKRAWQVHKDVFFLKWYWTSYESTLSKFSSIVVLGVLLVVAYSLGLFVSEYMYSLIGLGTPDSYFPHPFLCLISFCASILGFVACDFPPNFDRETGAENWKVSLIAMGVIFIASSFWMLILSLMMLFFLSKVFAGILACVFAGIVLAGESEFASVTVGSLTGGVIGLMMGWSLDMMALSLSMVVAGFVGMIVGFLVTKVGQTEFLSSVTSFLFEYGDINKDM